MIPAPVKPLFPPAFLLLALAAAAPGQTTSVTLPLGHATKEGAYNANRPFYYEMARVQILYRATALAKATGLIRSLEFRRDQTSLTTYSYAALNRILQLDCYVTGMSPTAMDTDITLNRGCGQATTLYNGNISLPAMPVTSQVPAPWQIKVPFTVPLTFVTTRGNLLFEYILKGPGTSKARYYPDGHREALTNTAFSAVLGMPCTGKGGETFQCHPQDHTWLPGGAAQVAWCAPGPVPAGILVILGWRADRWSTIQLPFDLAPLGGTSTTKHPCSLYTNWTLDAQAPTGSMASFGPIPNDPALAGAVLYSQGLAPAPGANPLGVITGTASTITIGPQGGALVDGNIVYVADDLVGTTGTWALAGYCRMPVTRFNGVFN